MPRGSRGQKRPHQNTPTRNLVPLTSAPLIDANDAAWFRDNPSATAGAQAIETARPTSLPDMAAQLRWIAVGLHPADRGALEHIARQMEFMAG
jgi:hypothetical protein